jgi:glucokinase
MAEPVRTTPISEAQPPFFLGADVGGTAIKIGLVDDTGRVLGFESLATDEAAGPQLAMQRAASVLVQFRDLLGLRADDVAAIGLGAPGPMDLAAGTLVAPPQLPGWWNFNLRDCLAELTGLPVAFTNDANAAAFGEFWLGTGELASSMVLLTLGTGVGGGIISEGHLQGGANSFAGEVGHLVVNPAPDARLCAWGGGRGQLEAYCSASAVVLRIREQLAAGAASSLRGIEGELTSLQLYRAALDNDPLALEIIDETARWLGVGITTIVHVIDPGVVVIGGAMTFGGEECHIGRRFLQGVVEEFQQRTFENVFAGTTIGFAKLGADAGYLGAAGYARQRWLVR